MASLGLDLSAVRGVSVSGQQHGTVYWAKGAGRKLAAMGGPPEAAGGEARAAAAGAGGEGEDDNAGVCAERVYILRRFACARVCVCACTCAVLSVAASTVFLAEDRKFTSRAERTVSRRCLRKRGQRLPPRSRKKCADPRQFFSVSWIFLCSGFSPPLGLCRPISLLGRDEVRATRPNEADEVPLGTNRW